MSTLKHIQEKLQQLLYGNDPEHARRDNLKPGQDADYMLNSPQVVGYKSTAEQQYLFQNLITGLNVSTSTILDVGCGRGDLYGFIRELYKDHVFGYRAFDHNPIMASLAKEKYDLDIQVAAFENIELPTADWVIASGFFTQRRCDSEDDDLRKLFVDVDKMYSAAQQAVAFNLLSPINNKIHEGFFYVHPGLVMDMLIEKYRYVSIHHNYSNDVYTVTIFKIQ
jgi:SAM-dependent methyltransferase